MPPAIRSCSRRHSCFISSHSASRRLGVAALDRLDRAVHRRPRHLVQLLLREPAFRHVCLLSSGFASEPTLRYVEVSLSAASRRRRAWRHARLGAREAAAAACRGGGGRAAPRARARARRQPADLRQGLGIGVQAEEHPVAVAEHPDRQRVALGERHHRIGLAQHRARHVDREPRPGDVRHGEVVDALAADQPCSRRLERGRAGSRARS